MANTKAITLISGEKQIVAAAEKLNKKGLEYGIAVHQVICSALAHVKQHGNTTIIDVVVGKLHGAGNILGVDVFIRRFTNLRKMRDMKLNKIVYRKPKEEALRIDLDDALKTYYWELPENVAANRPITFDIDKRFISFIGQARKAVRENRVGEGKEKAMRHLAVLEETAKVIGLDLSAVEEPPAVKPLTASDLAALATAASSKDEKAAPRKARRNKGANANTPKDEAAAA